MQRMELHGVVNGAPQQSPPSGGPGAEISQVRHCFKSLRETAIKEMVFYHLTLLFFASS